MTKQEKIERYVKVGGKWRKVDRVPDMVEVCRCKDCKFYEKGHGCDLLDFFTLKMDDWFCAYGEKGAER